MAEIEDSPERAMRAFAEDAMALQIATERREYSAVHFAMLQEIAQNDGTTPSDLAARWEVKPDGMSKILSTMDSKGHVTATIDPRDRRVKRFFITDAGLTLVLKWLTAKGYSHESLVSYRDRLALTNPFLKKGKSRG